MKYFLLLWNYYFQSASNEMTKVKGGNENEYQPGNSKKQHV